MYKFLEWLIYMEIKTSKLIFTEYAPTTEKNSFFISNHDLQLFNNLTKYRFLLLAILNCNAVLATSWIFIIHLELYKLRYIKIQTYNYCYDQIFTNLIKLRYNLFRRCHYFINGSSLFRFFRMWAYSPIPFWNKYILHLYAAFLAFV